MITVEFDKLAIQPGDRVLDIGCGTGRHIGEALKFNRIFAVGVDLNPFDLTEAQVRLQFHQTLEDFGGGTWGLAAADILDLPFKDDFFDLVICSEVLEHIPDHQAAASEIIRVLKPGRDLVVSVPRYLPERICWALSASYHQVADGHIRIYTQAKLTDLLEGAGACLQDRHYAHSLHTPFWWLKCLLESNDKKSRLANLYHRVLVWDMMKRPWPFRLLENLLNPLLGKSLVLYFKKQL